MAALVRVQSLMPTLDSTLSHYGVSWKQLAVPCSEPLSNSFASKLDRWELLAPHIGLGERDIVEIKEDCRTYQEQRLGSLRKWREKFGSGATVISLVEALFEMRRLDLVGELCIIYSSVHQQQEAAAKAADLTPKKVPVEYERLLSCKEQMISEFSCDLLTMSQKLVEKDLIPPSLAVDSEPQDTEEKATKIVESLLKKVRFFPEKYSQLVSIIAECSWMSDLVELLTRGPRSPPFSPSPEEIDKFPYLKDPGLSKEDRDDLVAELEYRSKRIGRKFQVLVARTGRALKNANTTVDELRTLFGREDKILKALRKAKNMDKAILKLSKLSSFFDYELLMNLVEKYCHDQELYDDFVAYCEELTVFCRRRICEMPIDAFTSKKSLELEGPYLWIKFDKNWQISVNQIKDLEKQISDILQIKLHLLAVRDGCMELVLNPLRSVSEPFSQQQKKQLREIGVIRVYVGEEEYSLMKSEEAKDQDPMAEPGGGGSGGHRRVRRRGGRGKCRDNAGVLVKRLLSEEELLTLSQGTAEDVYKLVDENEDKFVNSFKHDQYCSKPFSLKKLIKLLYLLTTYTEDPGTVARIMAEVFCGDNALFLMCIYRFLSGGMTMVEPDTVGNLVEIGTVAIKRIPSVVIKSFPVASLQQTLADLAQLGKSTDEMSGKFKVMCELFSTQKTQAVKDKVEKVKREKASKESEGDPPEIITELSILPKVDEMHVRPSEVFLRKNKIKGGYDSWEHYFDVQFRLLREDFIRPLRKGIADHCYYNGPSQRPSEIRVYEGARVLNPVCLFTGICFQLRFDTSKLRHVMWDYSKRLIYGSLLCLSNDRFNQCFIFATVQQSEPKLLKQGLLTVRFENGANAFQIDPNDTYMMVESTAYYEAYRHILEGLQELSTRHVMPMQKCIIDVDFSEIRAPAFLRIQTRPPYFRMADVLQKKDPSERVASPLPRDVFDVTNDRLWPDVHHTHLDESQLRALKMALSTEVSIIQGPPGTGKTYIGLKIVEAYLKNRDVWDPQKEAPILVVCFTNHALDQFLEGIKELSLDASDEVHPDIIRVGGRCKSEKLADCALNKRVRAQKSQKKIPQDVFKPYKEALSSLLREKDAIDALMENSNFEFKAKIIRLPTLQPVIDPKHVEQLRNPRESETVEGKEVDVWLGIWFAETEEDIETEAPLASANQPQQASTLQVNQPLTVPAEELSESSSDEDDLIAVDNQARLITEDRMIEGEEIALPEAQQLKKKYLSADPGIPKKETAHSADAEDPQRKAEGKSEWKTVQMSRRVQMRKIISGCCHNVPMAPREAASVRDVWSLKLQKRWRLYLYWKNEYIKLCKERVNDRATAYNDLCANYHQKQQEIDCHCSRSADVIGMTTTGAAKYRHLLQGVHPKIVIFEEAAEVLEAHVITSLASSVQQLILIGDHKQLRPKPTCYDLEKDYNLDISLFERLINNGFEHVTLEIQHRMRPEVFKLICPIIYNTLYDADNVKTYPHVMGVGEDVFFIDHTEPEEHNRSSDTKSHVNKYEVQYIVQLCHYLLKQGYAPQEITILTMYTGQLLEFRRQMKREIFEGVRVAAVDDFQGEENEIILLSLVRSNPENNIGFLRIENRVCVSLSRAKRGLYIIGNLKMLHDKHHTKWPEIIHHLEEVNAVGPALPLYCQVHQDDKIEAQVPSDFEKRPEGGCSKPCGARLPCGHMCERMCHPTDREHALTKCKKICGKILPSCGHNCRRKCHECSDQENKQCFPCSELVLKKLLCGHELMLRCSADPFGVLCPMICKKALPCLHSCKNACSAECTTQCREKVLKLLPCGHNTMVSCYMDPENACCPEECGTTLQCGHVCGGTCGKCQRGRLHVKCSIKCGRKLVCGHNCDYPCASICPPCTNSCNNFCSHGRCPKKCYELCTPCTKPCDWQCPHYGCTKPCGQPCDRPACNYRCYKMLKCGHPCIGLCGEKCPDKCRICNKDEVCKIFFGKEDEDNASFIQLQDCDHIFEVSEFDKWMRISNSRQVQFKVCPKCATPVVNYLRYGNTIKETWRDIEAIKRKQIQAVGDLNLHQRCREVERELLRLVGADYGSEDIDVIKKRIPTEPSTFSLFRAKTAEFQLSALPKLVKLHKIIKNLPPNVSASKCSPNYLQEHSSTLKRFLMKEFLSLQQMSDCVSEFRRLTCATKLLDLLSKMQAKKCHVSSVDHDSIIKELERAYFSGWKNQALTEVQEDQMNNMISRLNIKYGVDGLSYGDNSMIVSSIGLSNGNWFKCPRGHYYCVRTSKRVNPVIRSSTACPECSSTVGRSLTPAATLS